MDVLTINYARQDLEHLIGQVISDAEPVIICKENGDRAVLMSLDDFNSWRTPRFNQKKSGSDFWEGLMMLRRTIEEEAIEISDSDFKALRDSSPGREVEGL